MFPDPIHECNPLTTGAPHQTCNIGIGTRAGFLPPNFRPYPAEARPPFINAALLGLLVVVHTPAVWPDHRKELLVLLHIQPILDSRARARLEVAACAAAGDAAPALGLPDLRWLGPRGETAHDAAGDMLACRHHDARLLERRIETARHAAHSVPAWNRCAASRVGKNPRAICDFSKLCLSVNSSLDLCFVIFKPSVNTRLIQYAIHRRFTYSYYLQHMTRTHAQTDGSQSIDTCRYVVKKNRRTAVRSASAHGHAPCVFALRVIAPRARCALPAVKEVRVVQ